MIEVLYMDQKRKNAVNLYEDVDYTIFKLTFQMIFTSFKKDSLVDKSPEDDGMLLKKLFKEAFDSDIAKALLDECDDDQYIKLSRDPYRVRIKGDIAFVGARDNYKEIINYIIIYFGSSSKNLLKLINNCRLYLLENKNYDIEKGMKLNKDYADAYLIQLNNLISNIEHEINEWKELPGKIKEKEIKKLRNRLDQYFKLQQFWMEFIDYYNNKQFGRAIIYPILYSIINTSVILFDLKGNAALSTKPVKDIEEGKKYIICSSLNPDLLLGVLHTDHPVDTDDDTIQDRDLLCTKLNTDYLNMNDVIFEFEFVKEPKKEERTVQCRIKNHGKYLRALGLIRRSYILLTDDIKKDKITWKIGWSDSPENPYITIRSAATFPYNLFSIDIPNGNAYVEDLLCWIFLGNGSDSQKFYLYEVIET